MYMAPTKADAKKAYKEFIKRYQAKFPKAVECLVKDEDVLTLSPDRFDVCDGAPPHSSDQGMWFEVGVVDDGVQACEEG